MIVELGCQARLHTPFMKDPSLHHTLSKCVLNMGACSPGTWRWFLFISHGMLWPAANSCWFLWTLKGQRKVARRHKKDHMPSRSSLRHLASIITHCLPEKDGILTYVLGVLILFMLKTLCPASRGVHTLQGQLLPQVCFFFSSSLHPFLSYWRIKQSSQKVN